MSLRLGVACAVLDDEGRVLLSRRGDFNLWNLPGGRLDSGEALDDGAAREVREETGVIPRIERVVGLYYRAGWQRMDVLYTGWALGGTLVQRSAETRANAYFDPDSLPRALIGRDMILATLAEQRPQPQVITLTPAEQRHIKRRLRLRWMQNLFRGQPEPRYPHFDVRAVAIIHNTHHYRVLTLPGKRGRVLPRVRCTGQQAPWRELAQRIKANCRLDVDLHTVGIWQDPPRNAVEFIFAATVREKPLPGSLEWSSHQNTPLGDRDQFYVERTPSSYTTAPIWTLLADDTLPGNIVRSSSSQP